MGNFPPFRDILPPGVTVGFLLYVLFYFLIWFNRRHLLGSGREAEARKVIAQLNSVPEDDPVVIETMDELEYGIRAENEGGKATWMECFSKRNMLWKRTINGMMLQFIQQLNGQNFYCECESIHTPSILGDRLDIDYYGDTFFQSAGTEYET